MIISDCHNHTDISSDSDTPMNLMIESAINKDLKIMTITEHMDYEFPQNYEYNFLFEPDDYFDALLKNRHIYGDKIELLSGIEIGLKPDLEVSYDSLLSKYDWDYVIGSTHLIDEFDPYYPDYWIKSKEFSVRNYYETVLNNIQQNKNFDSLGHLDYILRYIPDQATYTYNKDELNLISSILQYIISNDIALEINTGGYKTHLNSPNPSADIIRTYINMGGKLITIGSDAHSPEYIAYFYPKVRELLISLGIKEYAVYKKRKPVFYEL